MLITVADLAASVAEFKSRYGFASIEGGRHVGWGTANRIVPLGDAYLELIAVADADEAAGSAFGRSVAGGKVGRPLGWVVRTDNIDGFAQRLKLTVFSGWRPANDGTILRWRYAGIEQAAAEPSLPFFIEWGSGTRLPGRSTAQHSVAPTGILRLILDGDPSRLRSWLGSHGLPTIARRGRHHLNRCGRHCGRLEVGVRLQHRRSLA